MANLQKGVLEKVKNFLDKQKFSYEVIVVDDGSKDGSAAFVKSFAKETAHFKLLQINHFGKAGAVTKGVLQAKGEHVLFTDMDQATPIEELKKLLPFLDEGYDIVIGSRNSTRQGAPWTRVFMAKSMIFLRSMIVGLSDIHDTQCGFKMFKKAAAQDLFTQIEKFNKGFHNIDGSSVTAGFDVELLYIAEKKGYKIKEVPVRWLYVETRRVNPVHDSIEGLLSLIKIRQNALEGKYRNL